MSVEESDGVVEGTIVDDDDMVEVVTIVLYKDNAGIYYITKSIPDNEDDDEAIALPAQIQMMLPMYLPMLLAKDE